MEYNHCWKNPKVAASFLDDKRKTIPFGPEQIDIMIRIISGATATVNYFIDLGCGDGILSHALLIEYPKATGLLIDYSEQMVNAAKNRLWNYNNIDILKTDFSKEQWITCIKQPVDVIISGFAIHHLSHEKKYKLYKNIYSILNFGGVFVNVERVSSDGVLGEKLFDELMIDNKYNIYKKRGVMRSRDSIKEEYESSIYKIDNCLLSVETQCRWLRKIGFQDVDCFFKCFELAVFAGTKK